MKHTPQARQRGRLQEQETGVVAQQFLVVPTGDSIALSTNHPPARVELLQFLISAHYFRYVASGYRNNQMFSND